MKYCDHCLSPLGSDGICQRCAIQLSVLSPNTASNTENALTDHLLSPEELEGQLPHLEIKRLIGHGGMGAIYQARQTSLDRDVAIKIIHREISNNTAFIDRFEREARALAKLSHPHIVTVFDFGRTTEGLAFLMMEYVDGINLRQAMDSMPIEPNDAIDFMVKMCQALHYAHSKGVVHRDIKPENVLLGEDGSIKIADFGIAKILDTNIRSQLTQTRQILGTPQYLAPEQLESPTEVDHRVDIFALGVVFYELLTKQLPLGHFAPPSAINSSIDPRLDAIVLRVLNRKPSQRYQDAQHIISDIQNLRNEAPQPTSEPSPSVLPGSATIQRCSIPFECQSLGGFGKTRGIVHFEQNQLRLEYRSIFLDLIKLDLSELRIPIQNLTRLSLRKKNFTNTLVIAVDSLALLKMFPNAESGVIEVKIKSRDFELAERMTKIATEQWQKNSRTQFASAATAPQPNVSLAMLMILLGILNAGVLAISQVVLANGTSGTLHVVMTVAVAILLGPLALFQISAGLLHLWLGEKSFTSAAAVASMLPISPVCLLGIPIGIWSLKWLKDESTPFPLIAKSNNSQPAFGIATRIFLRESRYAGLASILETVVGIGLLGFLIAMYFGCYPSELNFRIIDDLQEIAAMQEAVKSRLSTTPGVKINVSSSSRLNIRAWRFQRDSIIEQLALQSAPQLVNFVNRHDTVNPNEKIAIPSDLSKLMSDGSQDIVEPTQSIISQKLQLKPSYVSKLTWIASGSDSQKSTMNLEWSSEGRTVFYQEVKAAPSNSWGMLVNDIVEGVANVNPDTLRGLTFQMSSSNRLSEESIMAAIRGPELPSSLESITTR